MIQYRVGSRTAEIPVFDGFMGTLDVDEDEEVQDGDLNFSGIRSMLIGASMAENPENLGMTGSQMTNLQRYLYHVFGDKTMVRKILHGRVLPSIPQPAAQPSPTLLPQPSPSLAPQPSQPSQRKRGREDSVSGEPPSRGKKRAVRVSGLGLKLLPLD